MLCYAPDVKLSQSDLDLNETREVLVLIQERQFSFKTSNQWTKKIEKVRICEVKYCAPVGL